MKNFKKISKLEKVIFECKSFTNNNKELNFIYNELFELYSSNDDLESLKRSLFLQWYAVSEPQELTNIPDFDNNLQKLNIEKVERILKNNSFDDELIMMLKHYQEITEWYFISLGNFLNNINVNKFYNSYKKRGVMGAYWESITL